MDIESEGGSADAPLKVRHLGRYKDIARLVLRHSDAPSTRLAGLEAPSADEAPPVEDDGKPAQLARDLEEMGATFVKLGQLLSTRPDLLPPPYLEALARLQDGVEPFPYDQVVEVVEAELGARISKAFDSFEERPLAAASLGQVHRAILRDGRPVAVKVQRPGVREAVREDMEVLGELTAFADNHTEAGRKYAFSTLLADFRRALMAELNYRREAGNLEAVGDALSEFDRIVVPRPVPDYTTTRVLTMDLMRGRNLSALSPLARIEMDGEELLDQLFQAYLKQTLVQGLVHADPHPGNIFLTDEGHLALLDLGMVIDVSHELRKKLLRMLVALGDGDEEEVARMAEAMGEPGTGYDRRGFRREVGMMVARVRDVGIAGPQVGRLVMGIARVGGEYGVRPPPEMSLIGKTLLNLDGIAELLDPTFDPAEAIRRHTVSMTRKQMLRAASPGQALGKLMEARDFATDLPGRVNRALDAIGNNDMEVRVRVIDESRILTGLQQMANRIASGLVLAALIVGAALLMNVETALTLFGYPLFAILFFLAAALGGVALLYGIWRGDRETRRDTDELSGRSRG